MISWFRRRGNGIRLELGQSLGAFTSPDGDISPLFVFFEVANAGGEDVTLAAVRVTPRGIPHTVLADAAKGTLEGGHDLPRTLAPGESIRFQVRAKTLAGRARDAGHSGRARLEFAAEDTSGNRHRKVFRFRVDEYLRLKDE
ncbi:MAG TPA: hypothetical protein VFJ72_04325 [Rubrobacteraceae bacterium]|nr:hypothetical protein [Rubrobacteraceae bacterium]